jgi:hypothetical protein
MRVVVFDDADVEIFTFDPEIDRDYQPPASTKQEAAIVRALTEALRYALHIQQPQIKGD